MGRKKYTNLTKKEGYWWTNHFNAADIPEIEDWKKKYADLQKVKLEIIKKYVKSC